MLSVLYAEFHINWVSHMLSFTYAECHYTGCHICFASQVNAICRVLHMLSGTDPQCSVYWVWHMYSITYSEWHYAMTLCRDIMPSDIMPSVTYVVSSHVARKGAYPRVPERCFTRIGSMQHAKGRIVLVTFQSKHLTLNKTLPLKVRIHRQCGLGDFVKTINTYRRQLQF